MRLPAAVLMLSLSLGACADRGTLELTIRDGDSGDPTPARVELRSEDGPYVVPDEALAVFGDCGSVPVHNWVPWASSAQALWNGHREIQNPYTGTSQFYTDGSLTSELPPGRYVLKVTKGIEYRTAHSEFAIERGTTRRVDLLLDRWVDLPREGWYGADDHLHIPRPAPSFDSLLVTWMAAEDLHVANLLQMGLAQDVHITPQHNFGPKSVYRKGSVMLVSGQENPRTHVLGHSIILGARRWIDLPPTYILYDRFWREAHAEGAVNGYAHWGLGGAEEGLAVWARAGLLDFIEVLNLGFPFYDRWYETLDLDIRIGPTAGTDYPCLPGLPGRERFYAKLGGPLELETWLDAIRRGRTFVTNGPIIDLTVEGASMGDEVRLEGPGEVRVKGRVRFDPDRDEITRLELVQGGIVTRRVEELYGPGEIRMETSVPVERSTWLALRATGSKRDETPVDLRDLLKSLLILKSSSSEAVLRDIPAGPSRRPSSAHTAAVNVSVAGSPSIAEQPRAREVVQAWLARLNELQDRFRDERIGEMAGFPGRGDGVSENDLLSNREALLQAIEDARRSYSSRSHGTAEHP